MTARQIRRAAERKAKKSARKQFGASASGVPYPQPSSGPVLESAGTFPTEAGASSLHSVSQKNAPLSGVPSSEKPASPARVLANRQNAQLSTGPKTEAGKTKASLNAVKTGLTGRTVLLPSDDAAAYEAHVARFFTEYAPANENEQALVQSIADTEWRLLRIPSLEMGIYAVGRLELASNFQELEDPQHRAALIEAKVFLTYQRQLNNLSIQEGRLRRQREKELAALQQLQMHRRQQQERDLREAVQLYKQSQKEGWTFNPSDIGFEITLAQIESRIAEENFRARGYSPCLSARFAKYTKKAA
jgi:hypothetical protein